MDQIYYQRLLIKQFLRAIAAVNPAKLISENLKIEKKQLEICQKRYDVTDKNIHLVGFGKAVLGMAIQCEKILGKHLKTGVICVPHNSVKNNSEATLQQDSVLRVLQGAENNLPDENAEKGASEIISLVQSLNSGKDHLIVLISGGGSALFTKPKPGITLAEKKETIKLLMKSGADINELNTVRKRLSSVKGGGFACLTHPIPTTCLIISDVINDPMDVIASGPTVPSSDSDLAAFNVLQKYSLEKEVPVSVLSEMKKPSTRLDVPIKNNRFPHVDNFIIGNNTKALNAGKECVEKAGFDTIILSNQMLGDIEKVSAFYANIIFQILSALQGGQDLINTNEIIKDSPGEINSVIVDKINNVIKNSREKTNICLIAGGETTVKVKGDGNGGRNQELTILTSVKVDDLRKRNPDLFEKYEVLFLFAGTDGQDGPTDAAGGLGGLHIVEKARRLNVNISEYLERSDSYGFLSTIDDMSLIKVGYTGTNVMDFHTLLIYQKV